MNIEINKAGSEFVATLAGITPGNPNPDVSGEGPTEQAAILALSVNLWDRAKRLSEEGFTAMAECVYGYAHAARLSV